MISSEVQRTLVKSPPELWAELSDPDALARHLGELGEIRITRVEPEKTVEWEAADTTGKVLLKSSGWGTKVTLTADRELPTPEPPAEPPKPPEPVVINEPAVEPEPIVEQPVAEEQPEPEPRQGFFARLFRRRRRDQIEPEALQAVESEPKIEPEPQVELRQPALEQAPGEQTQDIAAELKAAEEAAEAEVTAVLTAALDRLGAAHHRPFSRA
jgi:outer membrane biosynthesis protein TonB